MRMRSCRGRNSRGEFGGSFGAAWARFITGERRKGLSGPEDLPGVGDLLGPFRWFDALCINQDDTKERNHQVTQMGEIYRRARRVITCLGMADTNSTIAMRLLQNLERDFSESDSVELRPGMTYSTPWAKLDFLAIPKSDVANQKLKEF
jgi:hypothetical protein